MTGKLISPDIEVNYGVKTSTLQITGISVTTQTIALMTDALGNISKRTLSPISFFSSFNMTSGYMPKYDGSTFVNSLIYDNGTNICIGTTASTSNKLDVRRPLNDYGSGKNSIYGRREGHPTLSFGGTGWNSAGIDCAIKGYNNIPNPYTAGLSGYTNNDGQNSVGVIGYIENKNIYGMLGFQDGSSNYWAGYFNGANVYVSSNVVSAEPTLSNHLTTKNYVDNSIAASTSTLVNYVLKAGDTMTGDLYVPNLYSDNYIACSTMVSTTSLIKGGASTNLELDFMQNGIYKGLLGCVGISNNYFTNTVVGDLALKSNTGKIYLGEGTSADLEINDSGLLSRGIYASGSSVLTIGAGTRFVWNPYKASIRAGYVNSTQWDDSNIGGYSTAFGYNPTASGFYSIVAGGNGNNASASNSGVFAGTGGTASNFNAVVVGGAGGTASAEGAFVGAGYSQTSNGLYSGCLFGDYNETGGRSSGAGGSHARALNLGSLAFADSSSTNYFDIITNNMFGARYTNGFWFSGNNVWINNATNTTKVGVNVSSTTTPMADLQVIGETKSSCYIDDSYLLARSDSQSSTTSTTYQTKTTLNYTPTYTGTYIINYSFQVAGSDEKTVCKYRILQNDVTTLQEIEWFPQGPEAQNIYSGILTGFEEVSLTASIAYNFKIQYCHAVAGKTCYIKMAKINIRRIK